MSSRRHDGVIPMMTILCDVVMPLLHNGAVRMLMPLMHDG